MSVASSEPEDRQEGSDWAASIPALSAVPTAPARRLGEVLLVVGLREADDDLRVQERVTLH